jgi:hypothetical protein
VLAICYEVSACVAHPILNYFFIVMKQLSVYTLRRIPIVKTVLLFHIKTEKCDSESS